MPIPAIWGAGSYIVGFRVSDDHVDIVNKSTGVVIETPTLADAAFVLKKDLANEHIIEQTDLTWDDNNIPTFKFATSIPEVGVFMKRFRKGASGASAAKNAKTDENGGTIGGTTAGSSETYLIIKHSGVSGSTIMTDMLLCTIKGTSGSRTHKSGDVVMFPLEVVGVACKVEGGHVIPQGLFDATIWGTITAADRTIEYQETANDTMFLPMAA